ncbi:hypothetical protein [Longibacter salinarum]|nr:hypothetical protein [Longibacter salinarum]
MLTSSSKALMSIVVAATWAQSIDSREVFVGRGPESGGADELRWIETLL